MNRVLLTVEETAQAMHISRSKIYPLVMSGAIASVKIGAARRIPVDALEAFVARLAAEQAGRDA